jgi:hypothetical protein
MRADEYRRLYEACLEMAHQAQAPELQARWLRMAQSWFNRAADEKPVRSQIRGETSSSVTTLHTHPVGRGALRRFPSPTSFVIH